MCPECVQEVCTQPNVADVQGVSTIGESTHHCVRVSSVSVGALESLIQAEKFCGKSNGKRLKLI